MSTTTQGEDDRAGGKQTRRRVVTATQSLSDFVGAHPDSLRKIYAAGRPTDPAELGDAPRGRVLALEGLRDVHLLARPLVRALGSDAFPWKGKVFDGSGGEGQNVVLGRTMLRFRTERGVSDIDGEPTLLFHYDGDALGNPRIVWGVRDELRTVAVGLAIGVAAVAVGGKRHIFAWWGLETATSSYAA